MVTEIASQPKRRATGRTAIDAVSGPKIRENAFRDAVIQYAKLRGWLCYFTWNSKHSPAGFPDLVMVRGWRMVCAELKIGKNKTTPAQDEWLKALRDLDNNWCEVYLWRPEDWPTIELVLGT